MKNKRILYLYTGDHPLHRKFAESISADIIPLTKKVPQDYDVYFVEGEYSRLVALKKLRKIKKESKLIALLSDPRLFYLNSPRKFDAKKNLVVKTSRVKKFLAKKVLNQLDGVICVGNFEKMLFRKLNKSVPIRVVDPFIDKKIFNSLYKIKPDLDNQDILFIGNGPDRFYKGLDILIESFRDVKKLFPEAKLRIVGKWDIKPSWNSEGIIFEGRQPSISKYLKKSSIYFHPARGEAYGIVVIEAMLSGVPCIVSDITGAKEAVEKVDRKFVVPLDKEKIVAQIGRYFKMKLSEKGKLSKKFKKVAYEFKEAEKLKKFEEEFESLLGEIYSDGN